MEYNDLKPVSNTYFLLSFTGGSRQGSEGEECRGRRYNTGTTARYMRIILLIIIIYNITYY